MVEVDFKSIVGSHPARIGAGLALASLPGHLVLTSTASHQLAAVVLVLVAGIYVGFALQDGRARSLAVEASVALGFTAAALAGLWVSAWTIPAAYALHGLWDLAHHRHIATAMPAWYVPFCAVFDWVFAVGLVAVWIVR
jgi:hypothetical protein